MPSTVAIGVMAHNEEANIARLLDSVLAQTALSSISRVVVVASGCTDKTCEIVESYCGKDPRISLVAEAQRGGKVTAINAFMTSSPESILAISGADMVYAPTTIEALLAPFDDPDVGMVGSHPVPLNDTSTFVGFSVNLLWKLHHEISLIVPKMGELIAFRNVFRGLDPDMLADEVQIERGIKAVGFKTAYAPDAIIYNRGPETVREFVAQRSRWVAHNLQVQRTHRYGVSTWNGSTLGRAALAVWKKDHPRLDWFLGTAALEMYCRMRGMLARTTATSKDGRLWEQQASTKDVVRGADPIPHGVK
ncbi:MAG TPA: glycosyltransferase [Candidatus Eremiobacteraceae bacterium]|nr:glycosyltransferase [Candidatus Eremiobacteraceae bacterium]